MTHNCASRSEALEALSIIIDCVDAAVAKLGTNTVASSAAQLVSAALCATHVQLSALEESVHRWPTASQIPSSPVTSSTPGGPGGGSPPSPPHTPPLQEDAPCGTPVYDPFPPSTQDDLTPPEDWQADFDASIDALVGQ